jgi:hypothetical protein
MLLVLAAVLVGVVTTGVATALSGERVARLWAAATVADDGSARVTEVIDWDFGPTGRHGIFRDVPGLRIAAPIEGSSPDAPHTVEVTTAGTPRIRIGDPARTVRGLHRYVVTYTLDGAVRDGRLAWDAVGTSWDAPIENLEIHVTAPTALDAAGCTTGPPGSRAPCSVDSAEPGHLVARIDGLEAGQGVTVSAVAGAALGSTPSMPSPPATVASGSGVDPFVPGVLAGVLALLAAALASLVILRAGRENVPTAGAPVTLSPEGHARIDLSELAGHVVPSPSLPRGLSPAEGGLLLAGRVLDQHKAAWLIDQAVAGVVELASDDPTGTLTLVRVRAGDQVTARLLDVAFRGRDRLTIGAYDRDFARMWDTLGRRLSAWQGGSGLWDADADRRAWWTRVVGTLTAVVGVVAAVVGGYLSARQTGLPLVVAGLGGALAGAGATGAARGWELRVLTSAGSASWLQVESLRQFLAQQPSTAVDPMPLSGQIGRYTAWAVALGEAGRWSQLASRISDSLSSPDDARGLLYAGYAPMFVAHCSTSSVASSASSSGGGGGVGVGGGAGGGGAGSW